MAFFVLCTRVHISSHPPFNVKVGKASPTEGTLPGAIYFIVKYQDNMIEAAKAK